MTETCAFEEYVKQLMDKYQVPAVSVGFAKSGETTYTRGFGHKSGTGSPPSEDTIFGIGSITKSFTAVAIMQLQERGLLKATDEVTTYIPEFRLPRQGDASGVTIHHFLTHTSGLPPLPFLMGAMKRSLETDETVRENEELWKMLQDVSAIDTYADLIEAIAKHDTDLLGAPGECFSYSNDAYSLLGAIVERVSGTSYEEFVTENILNPAQMTASRFDAGFSHEENVVTLFSRRDKDGETSVYPAPVWWEAPANVAAGFLKSTVTDMLKYAEIFRTGGTVNGQQILTEDSVRAMTHPFVEATPGRFYGYGLFVTPNFHGGTLVEHGGSLKGIQAFMSIVPEHGLTAVALTNLQGSPAQDIGIGLLQAELGVKLGDDVWHYESEGDYATPLETFEGKYAAGEGNLEAVLQDGELFLKSEGKLHRMERVGDTLFLVQVKSSLEPMRFWLNDSGEARAVSHHFRMILKQPVAANANG